MNASAASTAPLPAVAEDIVHANILRLLELVESDPDCQVERGELLRQLGRFDEAVAVLKAVKPNGHSEVKASKIQRWAQTGNSELQLIQKSSQCEVKGRCCEPVQALRNW